MKKVFEESFRSSVQKFFFYVKGFRRIIPIEYPKKFFFDEKGFRRIIPIEYPKNIFDEKGFRRIVQFPAEEGWMLPGVGSSTFALKLFCVLQSNNFEAFQFFFINLQSLFAFFIRYK